MSIFYKINKDTFADVNDNYYVFNTQKKIKYIVVSLAGIITKSMRLIQGYILSAIKYRKVIRINVDVISWC